MQAVQSRGGGSVSFSSKEVVVTCSGEEGIHMWDLHSGQHLMTYRNNSSSKSATWDSIGAYHMLAVQQKRSAIHIWNWSKVLTIYLFIHMIILQLIIIYCLLRTSGIASASIYTTRTIRGHCCIK